LSCDDIYQNTLNLGAMTAEEMIVFPKMDDLRISEELSP